MKIFIRTDASTLIGTGHVMRCLTLADQLKHDNHEVTFVYRLMPSHFIKIFEQNNFSSIHLENENSIGSILDALYVSDILRSTGEISKYDWLIVDHYEIEGIWETELKRVFENILVIDDLANRHHHCSVLLDANLYDNYESRYENLLPRQTVQLLGPKYALLRKEFLIERTQKLKKDEIGSLNLLVCFGGTDPTNETLKVLNALEPLIQTKRNLMVTVILGQANPNISIIQSKCHKLKNIKLIIQPPSMAKEIAMSDLAICGGGTMTWERYCLGLPGVVIAIADNQIDIGRNGDNIKIDKYLGESRHLSSDVVRDELTKILESDLEMFLTQASRRAMKIVDGKGAHRVAQFISKMEVIT